MHNYVHITPFVAIEMGFFIFIGMTLGKWAWSILTVLIASLYFFIVRRKPDNATD